MARPSKYELVIAPNINRIIELIQNGKTERQIAKELGIAYSTWNKYKAENKEFMELVTKSREEPVDNLISRTYQSGLGFTKTIKKAIKLKKVTYSENGKKLLEEEYIEYADEEVFVPPNFQAAKFLILNWGKDLGYSSEPASIALKEKELAHKIEQDKNNNW